MYKYWRRLTASKFIHMWSKSILNSFWLPLSVLQYLHLCLFSRGLHLSNLWLYLPEVLLRQWYWELFGCLHVSVELLGNSRISMAMWVLQRIHTWMSPQFCLLSTLCFPSLSLFRVAVTGNNCFQLFVLSVLLLWLLCGFQKSSD